jgi:hypothetical protein
MAESTSTHVEKSIKVITFYGKKKEWRAWEEKFLARAKRYGYKELLLGLKEIPKASEEVDAEGAKIRDLNELGYSDLTLSMDTDSPAGNVAFGIVRSSKSTEYPDGNIAVAWERLRRKYAPTTAATLSKYQEKFFTAKLKKGSDPDAFITYLEEIRLRMAEMDSDVTDKQFMLHVLNNLNSDYETQVTLLERMIDDEFEPLTIEYMREELNVRYERLNSRNKRNNDENGESDKALYAGGKFKGKCKVCGIIGHKAADCKKKNRNGRGSDSSPKFFK